MVFTRKAQSFLFFHKKEAGSSWISLLFVSREGECPWIPSCFCLQLTVVCPKLSYLKPGYPLQLEVEKYTLFMVFNACSTRYRLKTMY